MTPTFRENIAGLRPIRGLLISVAVSRSSVMLFPFYGAYLGVTRYGLSAAGIGMIVGAFGVGALGADVTVGQITRRLSERTVAVLGMVGVAATVLTVGAVSTAWSLVLLTAVWGFCYELINPVSYTLVAKAMPESARRFAFAAVRLAINVGMAIGPVIAGILFRVRPGLLVWGTAVGYLLAATILARAQLRGAYDVPDPEPTTGAGTGRKQDEFRFWSFFAAIIPIHLAYALPPTVISVYVIQRLGHPPIWVSVVFAVNALLVITCEIGINHVMNQWRRRTTLLIGYTCALVGFGLMGFAANLWMLVVATVIWTLGEMTIFPALLDHISAVSPARFKSRNIGLYAAGVNVGVLIAPLVFLPLSTAVDAPTSWGLVAAVLAIGLLSVTALSAIPELWTRDDGMAAADVKG